MKLTKLIPDEASCAMGTAEATLRMDSMEVKDEWQDEDFPRYPLESPFWGIQMTTVVT